MHIRGNRDIFPLWGIVVWIGLFACIGSVSAAIVEITESFEGDCTIADCSNQPTLGKKSSCCWNCQTCW